jgi:Multicopper oxidase
LQKFQTICSADSLVSFAGERFDFVLNANQSVGRYWLRVRGLMDCDQRFNSVHQAAIISYEGADLSLDPEAPVGYSYAKRVGKVFVLKTQIKSFI